jgi:hypothetical protein
MPACYASANYPFLSKWLNVEPSVSYNYSHRTTFVNSAENVTTVSNPGGRLQLRHQADSMEFSISGGYSYNRSSSTLSEQSNQKYSSFDTGFLRHGTATKDAV